MPQSEDTSGDSSPIETSVAASPPPLSFRGHPSFVIWGTGRAELDRVAIAVARAVASEVFWFDIQAGADLSPAEVEVLSRLDPGHSFRVAPSDVALDEQLGNLALWTILKSPEESSIGLRLSDYLRLPKAVREVIDRTDAKRGGLAIVVANADRATQFYAGAPGEFTPYLLELQRLGVSLILTTGSTPRANAADFDVVLHVERDPATGVVTVFCSRTDSRLRSRFAVGSRVPLNEFLAPLSAADEHPALS